MPEGELEISIIIENEEQFKKALEGFSPMMKNELYKGLVRTASREEKILKSTQGFTDRTGKLRRTLMMVATFNPLGIEGGTYDPKARFVAYAHGTWPGSFWESYKRGAIPRIFNAIERGVNKVIRRFNRGEV